ncbi:hydroquinone glucosyltransferase-like [Senna tora]|uniref:Glycosyltransferase n=1 Tax=Senna tora TaxID=362788 RepID=A0A834XGR4_9FABA|nr:hydroquinone glucosyltransferase-like [Senna tora]
MEATNKIHIALVSVPIYSHLLSILEFSNKLLHLHQDFHFTCIIPTIDSPTINAMKSLFQSLPYYYNSSSFDFILLPPPSNLHHDHDEEKMMVHHHHPALLVELTISLSLPSICEELEKLMMRMDLPPLVGVIADALVDEVTEFVKREMDVLSFVYFPSTAMMLSLCLYSSELDEIVSLCEYRDMPQPIEIPGCFPIHGSDLPDALQDRSSKTYRDFLDAGKRFHLADAVLINTFQELEPHPIKALQELRITSRKIPLVYPIGPIITTHDSNHNESDKKGLECLKWLDKKPPRSVLYVSFGSGGTLSQEQLNELALGLELSGQNFLWVFKPPSRFGVVADPSSERNNHDHDHDQGDPLDFLPSGFLERTKGQGLVVPFWGPQVGVLGHGATGGFVSHCGWNSVLESVVHGVPLVAWPLFAEQKMNAAMVSGESGLGVGLRARVNEELGIVEKEEIARVVVSLMEGEEGEEIRCRMNVLKEAAGKAMEEEDGSSRRSLCEFALKCGSFRSK